MTTDYFYQAPDDTVIVTAEQINFTFVNTTSGDDILSLVVDDPTVGTLCIALTAEQAYTVSEGLLTMITKRDSLRDQFNKENPK